MRAGRHLLVTRCCAKQDELVLRCLSPCSVCILVRVCMLNTDLYNLNQSVTLPTGFATVPFENIEDLFFLKILRISSHDKQ